MSGLSNAAMEGQAGSSPRLPIIDIARGLAVVAMAVYHTGWDLSTLALVDLDLYGSRGWSLFARAVAATFLVLAGIGLAVAHRDGIRWRPFLRRLGIIAAAAAAVTVATLLAFPDTFIFFGILHNMAASSLVAVPFLFLPRIVAALAALLFIGLPFLVTGGLFDTPGLAFLGLGTRPPDTYDWVPIFPWTGYVLAGIGIAPLLVGILPRGDGGRVGRAAATLGRYSLIVYLLHQPVIFGALSGLKLITGPNLTAEAAPFVRDCARLFREQGHAEGVSVATCTCTVEALRRDGIWGAYLAGNPSAEYAQRAGNRAAECLKSSSN